MCASAKIIHKFQFFFSSIIVKTHPILNLEHLFLVTVNHKHNVTGLREYWAEHTHVSLGAFPERTNGRWKALSDGAIS